MSMYLSKKIAICEGEDSEYGLEVVHMCPGCGHRHIINLTKPNHCGAIWSWDGNAEKPTFNPSINIVGICHYIIHDGMIQFMEDSKHDLRGQTVPLPDLPEERKAA